MFSKGTDLRRTFDRRQVHPWHHDRLPFSAHLYNQQGTGSTACCSMTGDRWKEFRHEGANDCVDTDSNVQLVCIGTRCSFRLAV
jgi:hypothetical protein